VILLVSSPDPSSRAHIKELRNELATIVARAVARADTLSTLPARASLPGEGPVVRSGIDVLAAQGFAPLRGLRVGLITNHTGIDSAGRRTIDLLRQAPGVALVALLSPEHGLHGDLDARVSSTTDFTTSLPVYSLYGDVKRPTDAMLQGMDALVFDVQDAGARFYTYITTLGYALEAATRRGLAFYVLDRPNPIGADRVQGPVLDPDLESFTGYHPLPVRHGMTVGELAQLFNHEKGIGARLTVIPMEGYRRSLWYDQTGLRWVNPSPNLRSLTAAALYPGVALVEGANVSVGRGTSTPFEVFGAPWMDGNALAAYLERRRIAGVRFAPSEFRPNENPYRDRLCRGVRLEITDRQGLDAPELGVEILSALWRIHPDRFALDRALPLVGSHRVLEAIREGHDPRAIARAWREPLLRFGRVRKRYLLY
jgi:uncharacterized protein YbbC (DUF1343 family)